MSLQQYCSTFSPLIATAVAIAVHFASIANNLGHGLLYGFQVMFLLGS